MDKNSQSCILSNNYLHFRIKIFRVRLRKTESCFEEEPPSHRLHRSDQGLAVIAEGPGHGGADVAVAHVLEGLKGVVVP